MKRTLGKAMWGGALVLMSACGGASPVAPSGAGPLGPATTYYVAGGAFAPPDATHPNGPSGMGQPMAGVTITSSGPGCKTWTAVTNAQGEYRSPVMPIEHCQATLTGTKPGYVHNHADGYEVWINAGFAMGPAPMLIERHVWIWPPCMVAPRVCPPS